MAYDPNSPRSLALSFVSNSRFHRCFDATTTHGPLKVSYAEYGKEPAQSENTPTLLLMPGMFSSRYLGLCLHTIAEKLGVRVLVADRPGLGNSTDVPLDQRVAIWVEIVPLLLAHLGIQHVALASHSAGTMYLMNTLYSCREILDPENPMVTFLAPWVDPACSGMTSMKALQYIPSPAFKLWHHIPRLFITQDGSAAATSGAMIAKFSAMFSSGSDKQRDENRRYIEEHYGLSVEQQNEIDSSMMQFMFKENTVGANSEAMQCARKQPGTWGNCEDYAVFVRDLIVSERGRERVGAPLKVQAYFGEEDSMIGSGGQAYFEKCWHQADGNEDILKFDSTKVTGTDHDSLVQSAHVWEKVLGPMQRTNVADRDPASV